MPGWVIRRVELLAELDESAEVKKGGPAFDLSPKNIDINDDDYINSNNKYEETKITNRSEVGDDSLMLYNRNNDIVQDSSYSDIDSIEQDSDDFNNNNCNSGDKHVSDEGELSLLDPYEIESSIIHDSLIEIREEQEDEINPMEYEETQSVLEDNAMEIDSNDQMTIDAIENSQKRSVVEVEDDPNILPEDWVCLPPKSKRVRGLLPDTNFDDAESSSEHRD